MAKHKKRKPNTPPLANPSQSISVDNRKNVILIPSNISEMTDTELKEMLEQLSSETERIKKECYSSNSPIIKIQERTFFDLVKKFFRESKQSFTLSTIISNLFKPSRYHKI